MAKNNRERVYKTYCISVADVEVQKYLEELKAKKVNISRYLSELVKLDIKNSNK